MKAEREDWTGQRRKQGINPWLIFTGTSAAIWVLIALFAKPIVINIDQLKQAVSFTSTQSKPKNESNPAEYEQSAPARSMARPQIAYASQEIEPENSNGVKQTSFNEKNYTPRGAINSMMPPLKVHYAANERQTQQQHITRRNNSTNWTWTGADRKKTHIQIQWTTGNGWIEFDTVCNNHKRGSIMYRDCRKAAKDYFRHRCKTESNQAFCLAENRYFP